MADIKIELREYLPKDISNLNKFGIANKVVENFLGQYYKESKEVLKIENPDMLKRRLVNAYIKDDFAEFDKIVLYEKIAKMCFSLSESYEVTYFDKVKKFIKSKPVRIQRVLNLNRSKSDKELYFFDRELEIGDIDIFVFDKGKRNLKHARYRGRDKKFKDSTFLLIILHNKKKLIEFKSNTTRKKENLNVLRYLRWKIRKYTYKKLLLKSITLSDFKDTFNRLLDYTYLIHFISKNNYAEEITINNKEKLSIKDRIENDQLEVHPEKIKRLDFRLGKSNYSVTMKENGPIIKIVCKRIGQTSHFIDYNFGNLGLNSIQEYYRDSRYFLNGILCGKTLYELYMNKEQIMLLRNLIINRWIKVRNNWKCLHCGKINRSLRKESGCINCGEKAEKMNIKSFSCTPDYEGILSKIKKGLPSKLKASIIEKTINRNKLKVVSVEKDRQQIQIFLYIDNKINKNLIQEIHKRNIPAIIVTKLPEKTTNLPYPSIALIDLIINNDKKLFAKKINRLISDLLENYEAEREVKMKDSMRMIPSCNNCDDFEIHIFNLMRGIFKNADYWGKSFTGVKIPDGISVFKLNKNKKYCISWDCKLSKDPYKYLQSENYKNPLKHRKYIHDIKKKLKKIKVYGKLGCYALITDNLSKEDFNRIVELGKMRGWGGKVILIETKALIKLANAQLRGIEFKEELWELLFNKKNKDNLTGQISKRISSAKPDQRIKAKRIRKKEFKII